MKSGPDPRWRTAIGAAIRITCAARHLRGGRADEFAGCAWEYLLDRWPRIGANFSGRSARTTYVVGVLRNFCKTRARSRRTRWRPSVKARSLGSVAVALDLLMNQRGYTRAEAVEAFYTAFPSRQTHRQLDVLADRLTVRCRPHVLRGLSLDDLPGRTGSARGAGYLTARARRAAARELRHTFGRLDRSDRWLLGQWHVCGRHLRNLAPRLGCSRAALYARVERLLRRVRAELLARGITTDVASAVMRDPRFGVTLFQTEDLDPDPPVQPDR
jgi:DNA-directed RNA polymerase specialized sigma24 family protein